MVKRWIAAFAAVICSFLGIYDYGEEQIEQGYALMEEGDYAGAGEYFSEALAQVYEEGKEHPDEETEEYVITEACRGIGMAAYELKDYQLCIDYLQKALDEGADATPIIYNLMGISAMKLEDYEGAIPYFENGLALRKDEEESGEETYQEMQFNKIVCYEQILDWESAKEEAEKYVALYPDDEEIQKEYEFLKTR